MKQVMLLLGLLISFSASQSTAEGRFYKPTDKISFTYEEFRKLSPEIQEAWIKELRNFNRNLDLVLDDQRLTARKPKFWSFLDLIKIQPMNAGLCQLARSLGGSAVAEAQTPNCTMKKQMFRGQEEICISCPGDLISGRVNECAPNDGHANTITFNLMAKIHQKNNANGKLFMDPKKMEEFTKTTMEKGSASFIAKIETVKASPARQSADPSRLITPLPEATAKKLLEERGKPSDYQAIENEIMLQKIEKASDEKVKMDNQKLQADLQEAVEERKKRPRDLDDTSNAKGNDNLDVEEVTSTDRLACVYAGWAVKAEGACNPVTEKEILDAEGKRTVYSCKQTPEANVAGAPVVAGENTSGKAIVLCNPVVFGLKDGKPICIARAKNATEECAKVAPSAADSLMLAQKNPREYRALTRRVDSLCQTDETKLRKHFEKRGKTASQVNNSIKDLSTTCVHLRTRMAQLAEANKGVAPAMPGER